MRYLLLGLCSIAVLAFAAWSDGQAMGFNITEPSERSDTVTTVLMRDGYAAPLIDYCNRKCGVVLGVGLGPLAGKVVRIAHMGHVNAPMVLGTLSVMEVGLSALRIPHGNGTQAAIEWLGESVSA